MSVSTQRYSELLKSFLDYSQANIDHAALEELKDKYKRDINSQRIFETIVDIKTLLKVLEKRGILQYNNIRVLEEIVTHYIKNECIQKLILDYNQWLNNNLSNISNLYSSGKWTNSLDRISSNLSNSLLNISKTEHPCDNLHESTSIHDNLEQCKDILLPNESPSNINALLSNNRDNLSNKAKKSPFRRFKKRKYCIMLLFVLLTSLFGSIGISVLILSQSTAILPRTELPAVEPTDSRMPFHMTTTNLGYSTNSRFFMNHAQFSATPQATNPAPTTDNEEQLRKRVINKVSKEIGKHWADVARLLNLKESDIDKIEIKYLKDQNYKQMFVDAMELYFDEPQPNWKLEVKNALEHARRRDLKEMLEGMMIS